MHHAEWLSEHILFFDGATTISMTSLKIDKN